MNIDNHQTLNVLYFSLGNSIVMHLQIKFSLLSIASQLSSEDCIVIMTDTPNLYKIGNLPCKLEIIQINEDTKKEWQTFSHNSIQYEFFWRAKIKAIQTIGKMYPHSHIMYLDGDTCLAGNISGIRKLLDEGLSLMHCDEGPLSKMRDISLRMWNQIKDKEYSGITICDKFHEWNAGVVAIPAGKVEKLSTQALAICDKMISEEVEPLVVEQYSLSVTLFNDNPNMKEAKPWIIHYWHNKYFWSLFIADFFCASYSSKRNLQNEITKIRNLKFFRINRWLNLKRFIRKHILGRR